MAYSGKIFGSVFVKITEIVKTEKWNTHRCGFVYTQTDTDRWTDRHKQTDVRTARWTDG
jgi:hypothetical protein